MTDGEVAVEILGLAVQLGQAIVTGIQGVLAGNRPDLVAAPPARQDATIAGEDSALIKAKFGADDPIDPPPTHPAPTTARTGTIPPPALVVPPNAPNT